MPKRLSDENKKEMAEAFKKGSDIKQLSNKYSLTESTVRKYLKSILGDINFVRKKSSNNPSPYKSNKKEDKKLTPEGEISHNLELRNEFQADQLETTSDTFLEILPLNQDFDFGERKDFASKPLTEESLPKNIYMVVDSNIELEVRYIKDYPDFDFLSHAEQERKVIKLFPDKKSANLNCDKSKKVIKIPDGKILKIVAPILLKKGISRIIYEDNLLSIWPFEIIKREPPKKEPERKLKPVITPIGISADFIEKKFTELLKLLFWATKNINIKRIKFVKVLINKNLNFLYIFLNKSLLL